MGEQLVRIDEEKCGICSASEKIEHVGKVKAALLLLFASVLSLCLSVSSVSICLFVLPFYTPSVPEYVEAAGSAGTVGIAGPPGTMGTAGATAARSNLQEASNSFPPSPCSPKRSDLGVACSPSSSTPPPLLLLRHRLLLLLLLLLRAAGGAGATLRRPPPLPHALPVEARGRKRAESAEEGRRRRRRRHRGWGSGGTCTPRRASQHCKPGRGTPCRGGEHDALPPSWPWHRPRWRCCCRCRRWAPRRAPRHPSRSPCPRP